MMGFVVCGATGRTALMLMAAVFCAALFDAPNAAADTFYLKNDSVVTGRLEGKSEGRLILKVGGRKVIIREDEVASVEENDQDGGYDHEEARLAAEQRDRELVEKTGLTAPQRAKVDAAMEKLYHTDFDDVRKDGREELLRLSREMDVFRYIAHLLDDISVPYQAEVLRAMFEINPEGTVPLLEKHAASPDAGVRAACMELLGRAGARDKASLLARGLLDHEIPVCIAAAKALGMPGLREATPALIKGAGHYEPRVENSCLASLSVIWGSPENKVEFGDGKGWEEFWAGQAAGVASPINPDALEPLVPKGTVFQNE